MPNISNKSPDHASQFTPFEWATILLLATVANAATFLEELLISTLGSAGIAGMIPGAPINYLLWGLTVAMALRIARRDGTATLYTAVTGAIFALVQPARITWAFGFVLAGIIIDTYVSGRRALALAEVAGVTLVATLLNRSAVLQQLFNRVTLDLRVPFGIEVPFFAVMVIVILATLFGRLHFQVLRRPTQAYTSSLSDTMVGVTLQPFIAVLVAPSLFSQSWLAPFRETPMLALALIASILFSSVVGGVLGFGLADQIRPRLGLD